MRNPLDKYFAMESSGGSDKNPLDKYFSKPESYNIGPVSFDPGLVRAGKEGFNFLQQSINPLVQPLINLIPSAKSRLASISPSGSSQLPLTFPNAGNTPEGKVVKNFMQYGIPLLAPEASEGLAGGILKNIASRIPGAATVGALSQPEEPISGAIGSSLGEGVASGLGAAASKGISFLGKKLASKGALKDYFSDLMNKITEKAVADPNHHFYNILLPIYKKLASKSSELYDKLGELGDQNNIKIPAYNFNSALDDAIKELSGRSNKHEFEGAIKTLQNMKPDLSSDITGRSGMNFSDIVKKRQELSKLKKPSMDPASRAVSEVAFPIQKALDQDIENASSNSGIRELSNLEKEARQTYAQKASMERFGIDQKTPFYKREGAGSFLSQYLKPSSGSLDLTEMLYPFTKHLSDDQKESVLASHLNELKDQSLESKIRELSKFSPNQINHLLGEKAPLAHELIAKNLLLKDKNFGKSAALSPFLAKALGTAVGLGGLEEGVRGHTLTAPLLAGALIASPILLRNKGVRNMILSSLEEALLGPQAQISPLIFNVKRETFGDII